MLKGLLKKARTAFDGAATQKVSVAAEPKFEQQLDLIVVPRSAMDAYPDDPNPLVECTVDFVNFLFQQAQFNRFEIPAEAVQAYHTDYYLAQVNNGGHAQFVGNSQAVLAYTIADVLGGLQAMGATSHLELAQAMSEWVAQNPDEAESQTGFEGGIADPLAALDKPFYDVENQHPIRKAAADWIAGLEILQVVDDDLMPRVLAGIKLLNPNLRRRQAKSRIAKLINQLSNPMQLGLGMAAASAKVVEPVLQIVNGAYYKVDGESTMAWLLHTSNGRRFGIVNETGAELREYIEQRSEELPDGTKTHTPTAVGPIVSKVDAASIELAKNVCAGLDAGIAIDLLLGKLPEETSATFLSVRGTGNDADGQLVASIFIVANQAKDAFSAIIKEDSATLLEEPTHKTLVTVSRAEIADYIAEIKAD